MGFTALRVRPTPTNILYTPVDKTYLHSIYTTCVTPVVLAVAVRYADCLARVLSIASKPNIMFMLCLKTRTLSAQIKYFGKTVIVSF